MVAPLTDATVPLTDANALLTAATARGTAKHAAGRQWLSRSRRVAPKTRGKNSARFRLMIAPRQGRIHENCDQMCIIRVCRLRERDGKYS
jgi:hypothetical protein